VKCVSSKPVTEKAKKVGTTTKLPIAVGLGVSTKEQAREVASYADGVIVGSAFIKIIQKYGGGRKGLRKVKELAQSLSEGVRGANYKQECLCFHTDLPGMGTGPTHRLWLS